MLRTGLYFKGKSLLLWWQEKYFTGNERKNGKVSGKAQGNKKGTKRCLKGLFPNINFSEKFFHKISPSFMAFTIYFVPRCFIVVCFLISSSARDQSIYVAPQLWKRSVRQRKKCHFDTFGFIHSPSPAISSWIHMQTQRRKPRLTFSIMVDIVL